MGMPSPAWDTLVRQARVSARRRKRRRRARRMLWLLTVVTTAVLAVLAVFIVRIARIPPAVRPAALSASAPATGHASAAAHRVSRRTAPVVAYPQVDDANSGLSYRLFAAPWQAGCPSDLITPTFGWTSGENTVAGHVNLGGSVVDWHGLACSGPLSQQFSYAGPADLQPAAMALLDAIDQAYYAGVTHSRIINSSSATRVSGRQAWRVEFTMSYPDGASQGLAWSTEPGAVVVTDRGAGQPPAVFYASVPANLGPRKVAALLGTLRLG